MFQQSDSTSTDLDVAVIGAGMSGICMAITLKRAGIDNFQVFEKAAEAGGTWRDNSYPGLTCDVPSHYYSYSFSPNRNPQRFYSTGPELKDYFQQSARKFKVDSKIAYDSALTEAAWDGQKWQLSFANGSRYSAKSVVCATGVLHKPVFPKIEGIDTFAGAMFHTAQWDHNVSLEGKSVGVIGTGSTAAQIVSAIPDVAGQVVQFQRTPQWMFPAPNFKLPKALQLLVKKSDLAAGRAYKSGRLFTGPFSTFVLKDGPTRKAVAALCRWNLRRVKDPELRQKLTPDYQPGCKRLIICHDYYDAVQKPNVQVVSETIQRIEPEGIRTTDGVLHKLDVLALATGFDAQAFMRPASIVGEGGQTLDQVWEEGPEAYRSVMIPKFPNLFMIMGPHSPVGNTSLVPVAEYQSGFALSWIKKILGGQVATVAPTVQATADYNQLMFDNMGDTVWVTGCQSWYLGKNGKPMLYPFHGDVYRDSLKDYDVKEFEVVVCTN